MHSCTVKKTISREKFSTAKIVGDFFTNLKLFTVRDSNHVFNKFYQTVFCFILESITN